MTLAIPTTLEGWCSQLSDWEHHFVKPQGQTVGCAFVKGNEIHCWRDPVYTGVWMTAREITRIIQPIITAHGYVTTKVIKANASGHKFVSRLGFYAIGEDAGCIHYKAERLKHERL